MKLNIDLQLLAKSLIEFCRVKHAWFGLKTKMTLIPSDLDHQTIRFTTPTIQKNPLNIRVNYLLLLHVMSGWSLLENIVD